MNVEYVCENRPAGCGTRIFAPPGGTRLKCRHHAEAKMVQTEETTAPDFLWVEEDGKTRSKDIIKPDGEGNMTRRMRAEPIVDRDAPPDPILVMEQVTWRNAYEAETGLEVDKRWGVPRIQEELMEWRREREDSQAVEGQSEGTVEVAPTESPNDSNEDGQEPDPELITTHRGVVVDMIPAAGEGEEEEDV